MCRTPAATWRPSGNRVGEAAGDVTRRRAHGVWVVCTAWTAPRPKTLVAVSSPGWPRRGGDRAAPGRGSSEGNAVADADPPVIARSISCRTAASWSRSAVSGHVELKRRRNPPFRAPRFAHSMSGSLRHLRLAATILRLLQHPGRLAQLVRALARHARGRRFESCIAHHETTGQGGAAVGLLRPARRHSLCHPGRDQRRLLTRRARTDG